jgi:hypothetical protein
MGALLLLYYCLQAMLQERMLKGEALLRRHKGSITALFRRADDAVSAHVYVREARLYYGAIKALLQRISLCA